MAIQRSENFEVVTPAGRLVHTFTDGQRALEWAASRQEDMPGLVVEHVVITQKRTVVQ